MIETGISLVAANLPTLRFLVRKLSFEQFYKYIGSIVSLELLRVRCSQLFKRSQNVKSDNRHMDFTSSHNPVANEAQMGAFKTYGEHDIESQEERR